MPFPFIVGAILVGGILFLLSDEEDNETPLLKSKKQESLLDSQDKIRELRRQLRQESKRKKSLLRELGPTKEEKA